MAAKRTASDRNSARRHANEHGERPIPESPGYFQTSRKKWVDARIVLTIVNPEFVRFEENLNSPVIFRAHDRNE
jgi:hypothetical protein